MKKHWWMEGMTLMLGPERTPSPATEITNPEAFRTVAAILRKSKT